MKDKFIGKALLAGLLVVGNITFAQQNTDIKIVQNAEQKRADVFIGDELFTSLLYADSLKKAVLYPVNAAGNITVTRGWPIAPKSGDQIDHPHQIGVWFNYGDVNSADYWNNSTKIDTNKKAYGTIKLNKIISSKNGKGKAELVTHSTWYNPGGKPMLEEISTYIFSLSGNERIIDRMTSLRALEDISFKDNKEGLFAIRVARQLEYPSPKAAKVFTDAGIKSVVENEKLSGRYENSNGIIGEEVFGTRSKWLKLSGRVDNKPVAVAIIDHPGNAGYPGYWMARGYGLFAINPLGAQFYTNGKEKLDFKLGKGSGTEFKYRLVIAHILESGRIEELSDSFKSR